MWGKKGVAWLAAVLFIIIIVIIIVWLVNLSNRECSKDSDCSDGFYCGSDFSCHEFKIVEKTTVNNDLIGAGIIIAVAIIIAAIILRYRRT